MKKRIDMTGERYGRLRVLYFSGYISNASRWHVRCDCGVEFDVCRDSLVRGFTRSCGCIRAERGRSRERDEYGKFKKREI